MNGQSLQRKQVKEGFDPLGMIRKEDKQKTKILEDKHKINSNFPDENKLEIEPKKLNSKEEIIYPEVDIYTNISNNKHLNKSLQKNIFINNDTFFLNRDYIKSNFDFIRGENLIDYDEAYYKTEDMSLTGIIVLTDYRIIFKFRDDDLLHKMNLHPDYFKIPLFHITKIEKSNEKKNMTRYSLDIVIKDTRVIKFIVQNEQLKFFANLNNYVYPRDYSFYYSFCYKYKEAMGNISRDSLRGNDYTECNSFIDGWKIYNPIQECVRQGINFYDDNTPLKISELNKDYSLCSTYPELLIVPKALTDEEVKEASCFRTKNRFPVMSYVYLKNNKVSAGVLGSNGFNSRQKFSYPSIWRSSQTKSGITGQNRSSADEKLLKVIGQLSEKLIIYDARPYINALANRIKGGGFENINNYSNTELHFCEIGNIHDVRSSLAKMFSLCLNNKLSDNKKFLSSLEQTEWFSLIHLILKYSNEIALSIKKNYSVLVHCSDGWDRSTQLITTSEILIDPYYRSFKGFMILIEKEWLGFGHQFGLRNGIYIKEMHEDQTAPIFLQWLDCIHQLLIQFPNAFEFNLDFLMYLAENCNTNLYGTFLFNCQQERLEKNTQTKTISIWTDILNDQEKLKKFSNPFYESQGYYFLRPNCSPHKIRLWEDLFLKFNPGEVNPKLYLNYENDVYVKNSQNFFMCHKIMEQKKEESLKRKLEELVNVLADVYNKTYKKEIYDEFNETTKFILSNLNISSNEVEAKYEHNEINKMKQNKNNNENVVDLDIEEDKTDSDK